MRGDTTHDEFDIEVEMSYIEEYSNVFLVGSPTVHIAYYVSR